MQSRPEKATNDRTLQEAEDDGPDDWDKRIIDTGCADENDKLRMCFVEKKDWRLCKAEMETFKKCWAIHGNQNRTDSKDV